MLASAPLWDNNKANDSNTSDGMSRSTSVSTLSKVDSIKSQSISLKAKGLWSNNSTSQTSLRPNNLSGRLSAPPTPARRGTHSISSGQRDSSDDESMSSSSDEKPFSRARPVTPPKPNILKQIRRSSTTQNVPQMKDSSLQSQSRPRRLWTNEMRSSKSEFNLSHIGRETPVKLRSNSSSSNSGLWATPPPLPVIQNERLDLSMTNPSTVPRKSTIHLVLNFTKNVFIDRNDSNSRVVSTGGQRIEFNNEIRDSDIRALVRDGKHTNETILGRQHNEDVS